MNSKDDSNILVKLKSKDGQIFEIEDKCLDRAKFFENLKDIMNLNNEINVDVDSTNLKRIIEYLKHYLNEEPEKIPKPLTSSDLKQVLNEWDYTYISSVSLGETIDLINAANYMGIEGLVHLCSSRIAFEMNNCSIEEARAKFGVVTDMSEEELKEYNTYPLD